MSPLTNLAHLVPRGNDALKSNPPTGADAHITTHGSDWLWAVFAVFALVDIILFAWCLKKKPGTRFMTQLGIVSYTACQLVTDCRSSSPSAHGTTLPRRPTSAGR